MNTNATTGQPSTMDDHQEHSEHRLITIFLSTKILPAIYCLGAIGNFLIIIYFVKINRKKLSKMSAYHFLIINLAIADFLTCFGLIFVSYFLGVPEWKLGKFGCSLMIGFFSSACPYVSCWILVLLSYTRYRSIVQPFKPRMTKAKCSIICLIIWILCIIGSLDNFLKRNIIMKNGHRQCITEVSLAHRIIFSSVRLTLDSGAPISILSYFYIRIKRTLAREDTSKNLAANDSSRQRNQNALKTIFTLVVIYVICVCPGRALHLMKHILLATLDEKSNAYSELKNAYGWINVIKLTLIYLNNVVNIFVYMKLIIGFRNFLLVIVTFGRWRNSEATLEETTSRT